MLNAVLYQDFDERWIYRRTITKVVFVLLYMIFLPLWSVVYLLTPHNKLSQKLATPLAKFLSHTCSFCWFLIILVLSSIQDTFGISLLQVSWIGMKTVFVKVRSHRFNPSLVHSWHGVSESIVTHRGPPSPLFPHPFSSVYDSMKNELTDQWSWHWGSRDWQGQVRAYFFKSGGPGFESYTPYTVCSQVRVQLLLTTPF